MGRASLALLKGDIASSFNYHILCIPFTLIVVSVLIWLFHDVFLNKETFFTFIKKDIKTTYKIILFVVIFISWAINIFRQV